MKRKRSLINIASSLVGQVLSILMTLLFTRYLLLWHGSATNGLINSVTQIFAYFILLEAGVGAASLQALYLPVAKRDRAGISSIMAATKRYYDRMSVVYLAAVIVFAAVYALLMGGKEGIETGWIVGVILFIGLGNVVNFVYQGKYKILLQAEGRNYVVTNAATGLSVFGSLVKIAAILNACSIVVVMGVGFLASLLQTLYYYYYVTRHYSWLDLGAEPAKIRQTESVMVHQISQLVFQNTDVIILTAVAGLRVVSVYATYKVVVTAIGTFTYQFSENMLFALGQEYATDREKYTADIDRFDLLYTAVSFILFSVAYLLYLPFIGVYTDSITDIGYLNAHLPILFILIELLSGCRRAMQNTINVAGHFRATVGRTIAETVINLAVSLALVGPLGIYGVLLGTIAALLYRSNDIILYANHRLLGRSARRSYRLYLVHFAAFVPIVLITHFFPIRLTWWGSFVLWGVLMTAACVLWYSIIDFIFFRERIRGLRSYLRD